MTSQTTSLTKLSAAIIAVALVTGSLFALATQRAHAVTLSELVELFIALEIIEGEKADQARAVVAQQTPTPGTPAAGGLVCPATPFTGTMSQGASSQQVLDLQKFLNSVDGIQVAASGAGSVGNETMYFGPATRAAVVAFQNKYAADVLTPLGLSAGTGFAGSATIAKINALCAAPTTPGTPGVPGAPGEPTEPTTPTTPTLGGGEGYLEFDMLIESDVDLDSGETAVVLEAEVEAKDSDIMINRVDFMFSERPWLFYDEVNLLIDGEEVGSLDASGDFTEVSGNYRARFTGLDQVIEEGDTAEISLELVAMSALPSTRYNQVVEVWLPEDGIRAVDGAGLDQYAPDADEGPIDVRVTDTFGDGDISVSLSDNSPENATVILNETSRTDGVDILFFNVEAEDSDMEVTDVTVEFDSSTSTIAEMVYRARLFAGNTLLATETVTGSSTTFDDLDYAIDEDDEVEFRVELEFNDGDSFPTPATFSVENVVVEAENEDFVAVNNGNGRSLTVEEDHTVLVNGIDVALASAPTIALTNDDKNAKFTFILDVTAYGEAFFFDEDGDVSFDVALDGSASSTVDDVVVTSDATLTVDDTYRINKGQTREVKVEVFVTANPGGTVRATLVDMTYNPEQDLSGTDKEAALGSPTYRSSTTNIIAS